MNAEHLKLLRVSNRARYLISLITPEKHRDVLVEFYNWFEELEDIKYRVSEPMLGHIRLQWWRETLDVLFTQGVSENPFCQVLEPFVQKGILNQTHFETLLGAFEEELDLFRPSDLSALEGFIERKYGSFFYLIASVLLEKNTLSDRERDAVYHVALCYGHVELLAKAVLLLRKQIIYLPQDLLDEADVVEEEIANSQHTDVVQAIGRFLVERAKTHSSQAYSLRKYTDKALAPLYHHLIFANDRAYQLKQYHYMLYVIYPCRFRIRTYIKFLFSADLFS